MERDQKQPDPRPATERGAREPETTNAQEWAERVDTGKTIARGGKNEGHVPGAEPSKPE